MKYREKRIEHEYLYDREEEWLMKSLAENKTPSNFIKHEFIIKHKRKTSHIKHGV